MRMPASMEPDWKALLRVLRAHSATFYLGSLLFPKEARKGAWAVYAACRLGDEAVDWVSRYLKKDRGEILK